MLAALLCLSLSLSGCSEEQVEGLGEALGSLYEITRGAHVALQETDALYAYRYDIHHSSYAGEPSFAINGAGFSRAELDAAPEGIEYEPADGFGRALSASGIVTAGVPAGGPDDADMKDPSGWNQAEYPGAVPDGTLYRRVLLFPESLGGAAVPENIMTGTAYMQSQGLAPLAARALEYAENHPEDPVLWEARAVYDGLARLPEGVFVRASCTDGCGGFEACAFFYNVQPGIGIDYSDGTSWLEAAGDPRAQAQAGPDRSDEHEEDGADGETEQK